MDVPLLFDALDAVDPMQSSQFRALDRASQDTGTPELLLQLEAGLFRGPGDLVKLSNRLVPDA